MALCDEWRGAAGGDQGSASRTMAAQRGAPPAFDFGPGRGAWEATYGTAAERIADWLPMLAEGMRRHAQAEVYRQPPGVRTWTLRCDGNTTSHPASSKTKLPNGGETAS